MMDQVGKNQESQVVETDTKMVEGADQPKRSEFFNGVDPKALLTSNNVEGGAISVNFSIDMSPAAQHTSQPFDASNDSVYLFVDTLSLH